MVTFLPSQATASIQILPLEVGTNLTISAPSSAIEGEQFNVTGLLTRVDTGVGISGEDIHIRYNGTVLGIATTDANGNYSYTTQIGETGSFTITAEFQGSTRPGMIFKPSQATTGVLTTLQNYIIPIAIVGLATIIYLLTRR